MAICTIIAILLVVLFVGATIWKTKKVPESISAMVYDLPDGALKWTWSIWIWLVDIFSFIPVIDVMDSMEKGYVAFIPMVLLAFVGAWPLFDTERRKYHYAFAIAAGVLSQLCVWFICHWWLLLWLIWPAICAYCYIEGKKGKDTIFDGTAVFVSEVICYIAIICSSLCRIS